MKYCAVIEVTRTNSSGYRKSIKKVLGKETIEIMINSER